MLNNIKLYIGLPGSGKTFCANDECDIVIDDITDVNQLPSMQEIGTKAVLGITDVNFCDENVLYSAFEHIRIKYPYHGIDLEFFENAPEKCHMNVEYRNDGRKVSEAIDGFSSIYDPPEGARIIWTNKEA